MDPSQRSSPELAGIGNFANNNNSNNNSSSNDDFDLSGFLNSLAVEDMSDASLSPPLANMGGVGANNANAFSDSENSDTGELGAYSCNARMSNDNSYSSISSVNSNHSNNSRNFKYYDYRMATIPSPIEPIEPRNPWRYSPNAAGSPIAGHRSPLLEAFSPQGLCSPILGQRSPVEMQGTGTGSYPAYSSPMRTLDDIWQNSCTEYNNEVNCIPPPCKIHIAYAVCYCETCSELLCNRCVYERHFDHKVKAYHLAIEAEAKRCQELAQSTIATRNYIQSKEDDASAAIASLTTMKDSSQRKVSRLVRDMIEQLQRQEQEMLEKIDEAYRSKVEQLKTRRAVLAMNSHRLNEMSSNLTQALNNIDQFANPLVLSEFQDEYLFNLYDIRSEVLNMKENPSEIWIDFQASDPSQIFRPYGELGVVITKSYGAVGDHREARVQYSETVKQLTELAPVKPLSRGQVLPGSRKDVIARLPDGTKNPLIQPILEIGSSAPEKHKFCRPWGVACDPEGKMFVADRSNNRIMVFSRNGQLINEWGTHGSGPGQYDRPAGIAIDSRKRVVVVDKDNHRIQLSTKDGKYLFMFGEKGNMPGQFNYPWDVAVNSECEIVVSDTRNHRIQQFSPNGTFLRRFGFESTPLAWKSFDSPRGVAFDPQGDIVITDFNTHRVVKIDREFATYVYLSHDDIPVTFSRPQGLLIDDAGNFIIADSKNCQIVAYNKRGEIITKIGVPGQNLGELDRPSGMALTPEGRLVVVDFGNNRVVVY